MRAVVQRVSRAAVSVENEVICGIHKGLVILLGIESEDLQDDIDWLCKKISALRIFSDEQNHMNLDINQIEGEAMVVSQFTLHASTKKGNRPSFVRSAPPEFAKTMYDEFIATLKKHVKGRVCEGQFGANMQVELINDGPVTIWLDTKNKE